MWRRWWVLVVVGWFGALVWLSFTQDPAAATVLYAAWGLFVVAAVVQAVRRAIHPSARGRSGAMVTSGVDEVQGLLLGRPDLGPVEFGRSGPTKTELVLDRPEPNPADLR